MHTRAIIAQLGSPLAQGRGQVLLLTAVVLVFLWLFSFCMLIAKRYKKCPSNKALVITGRVGSQGQGMRVCHGGAKLVWPLIQDYDYLELNPIGIAIPLNGGLSCPRIEDDVQVTANVAIGTEPALLLRAAERLLGLPQQEVQRLAKEIIVSQLRPARETLGPEEVKYSTLPDELQAAINTKLNEIGLVLINVNIIPLPDEGRGVAQPHHLARGNSASEKIV